MIKKIKNSSGFTIVELMISLGILSLIVVGVMQMSSRIEKGKAYNKARDFAKHQNLQIIEYLKRDMKYQTQIAISNNGLSLSITRPKTYDMTKQGDEYTVAYQSQCIDIPDAVDTLLKVYKASNAEKFSKSPCLERLRQTCSENTYPQVSIIADTNDTRIPAYKPSKFPDLSKAKAAAQIRQGGVGSALCFDQSNDQIRIIVSSIYLTGPIRDRETFQVETQQVFLSTGNIAGIRLLPNE